MPTRSRAGVALLLLALVWAGPWIPAAAGQPSDATGRTARWTRYDVDLDLKPDGLLSVAETQEIAFQGGPFRKGSRSIPLARTSGISDVRVSELRPGSREGQPRDEITYTSGTSRARTFSVSRNEGNLLVEWWFESTTNASRTFLLRYAVQGGVRVYDGGDQVWWKAIYADRRGQVDASAVTLRFPSDVSPDTLRARHYRTTEDDAFGSDREAGMGQMLDPRTVRFQTGALEAGAGAEIRAQFPHGLLALQPPAWQAAADREDWIRQFAVPVASFLALLLGVGVLGGGGSVLFINWTVRGRDPGVGRAPHRLQEPPSDLPAPLAGTLVDEVADVQDAVAILSDLAERGIVTLDEVEDSSLVGSPRDARVTLNSAPVEQILREYERLLLAGIFGWNAEAGARVELSRVRGRFAATIGALRDALHRAATEEGLFEADPENIRRRYQSRGRWLIQAGIVLAIGASVASGGRVPTAWLPGAALAALGGATHFVARAMPRRTRHGALEAARWRAFAAHLAETAPGNPDAARRYLPYAVAFGVDQGFLRRLEEIGAPPPSWYGNRQEPGGGIVVLPFPSGGGAWDGAGSSAGGGIGQRGDEVRTGGGLPGPQGWSDGLADLLTSASDALASGGGSGGWSGGGFDGGGGGGGGSGGFE